MNFPYPANRQQVKVAEIADSRLKEFEVRRYLSSRCILTVCVFTLLALSSLYAQRWNTYTNTNHVTDFVFANDKAYSATWGGIVEYNLINSPDNRTPVLTQRRTLTTIDGICSNDIRTIAYQPENEDLWIGSANDGISILKTNGLQHINSTTGLTSNKIRRIITSQNYIYVATDNGISQFYYLEEVNFPLLLNYYNTYNTQGGLLSNDILDINIALSGYLYCATPLGISYVHTDSLQVDTAWRSWTNNNSPIPAGAILSMSSNQNYLVFNTLRSIQRHSIDPFTNDWRSWTISTGGLADSVLAVGITQANIIFFSYGGWNEDTMYIMQNSENNFGYIDTADIIHHYPTFAEEFSPEFQKPDVPVFSILFESSNLLFLTWGQGIYLYKHDARHVENNCIGFQTIVDIKTDLNNNVWFGSGWIGPSMTKKGTRGVSRLYNGHWQTYNVANSPLTSNNIRCIDVDFNNKKWFGSWDSPYEPYHWRPGVNVFDDETDDWKWYTRHGIRQYYPETGWSDPINGTPTILNNTIADIYVDKLGNIHVSSSGAGAGITVFNKDYDLLGTYQMPNSLGPHQSITYIFHSGSRYFYGLNFDDRLLIWDNGTPPLNDNSHWIVPAPPELTGCKVYGVVSITNVFGVEENWIATSQALIMWNGTNWYKYGRDIKARIWKNSQWCSIPADGAIWYYVDEERLFASAETKPTAIFLDPYGRIWIGSMEKGVTMYDPDSERFTNYFQGKSPLISNYITCFGYDPIDGNLLIGTPEGLNTLEIGITVKTTKHFRHIRAYPNPFYPDRMEDVKIINLPTASMPKGKNTCKIYNSAGEIVIELIENRYARFDWNGLNNDKKKCSTGIYYYVVSDSDGETRRGKIALIRGK